MENKSWTDILTKDASFEEIMSFAKQSATHLRANLGKLIVFPLLIGLLAFLLGLTVYKQKQKAVYIIAAEEETSAGWEGLLAQFGLDIGGSNPGGVFMGESLVHLFQTRSMIERALLTPVPYKGAEVIAAELLFKSTRHAHKKVFKGLEFNTNRDQQDRLADSALFLTYKYVRAKVLNVSKPEKKMGFIYVNCIHSDPDIAMGFSKVLISTVTTFYIESLTQKARKNLDVLRTETDSVQAILTQNLKTTAFESDLNINPLWQAMRITHNRAMIDLQISIALFGELIKNLKLAEIGLRKQTPLVQIIEAPRYPLERVGFKPWQLGVFGLVAGLLLALYFTLKQFNKKPEESNS